MNNDNNINKKENTKPELTQDKPVFSPLTDIYESMESIYVVCDVPGVQEKNIDISLENDVLTITAYQDEEQYEGYQALYKSYDRGIFQRSFTLSQTIDKAKIKATVKQGVLKIELPKSEEVKPKKISVEIEK